MMQPQRQPSPQPAQSVATPADARRLAAALTEIMDSLLAVIERETELVRAGKIADAMRLERDDESALGIRAADRFQCRGELARVMPVVVDNAHCGFADAHIATFWKQIFTKLTLRPEAARVRA